MAGLGAVAALAAAGGAMAESPCGEAAVVERGETLTRIAERCEISVAAILAANPHISDPNVIRPGQSLTIPAGETAEAEDSEQDDLATDGEPPFSAAEAHQTTVADFSDIEAVLDPDAMPIGRIIEAPGGDAATHGERSGSAAAVDPGAGAMRISGRLMEGLECLALHGDDGNIYSLAMEQPGFQIGDRVEVTGTEAQASFCLQGTTIDVESIRPEG